MRMHTSASTNSSRFWDSSHWQLLTHFSDSASLSPVPHSLPSNKSLNSRGLHTDSQSSQTVIWTVSHVHKILTWRGNTGEATQPVSNLTTPPPRKRDYLSDSGARPLADISPSILCPQLPVAVWTGLYSARLCSACQFLFNQLEQFRLCLSEAKSLLSSDVAGNEVHPWGWRENSFTLSGRLKLQGHGNLS